MNGADGVETVITSTLHHHTDCSCCLRLAQALRDAGFGDVAAAKAGALREAADEVADWEFPLPEDASKDAVAARVVLLERLARLVTRLRNRADQIDGDEAEARAEEGR